MSISRVVSDLGRPVAVFPTIIRAFGDANTALIVCQFMYWREKAGDRAIYKTQSDLEAETAVKPHTQTRIFKKLSGLGLVRIDKKGIPAKNHFYWNWEKLDAFIRNHILQSQQTVSTRHDNLLPLDETNCNDTKKQTVSTITETTQKTTTETTTENIVREKSRIAPPIKRHNLDANFLASQYGLTKQIADDWLTIRKAKRSPLTQTALNAVEREAGKAGISVAEAIEFSCEAGWVGFKADWYENRRLSNNNNDYRTAKSSIDRLNDTGWASTNAQPREPVEVQTTGNLIESTDWHEQ